MRCLRTSSVRPRPRTSPVRFGRVYGGDKLFGDHAHPAFELVGGRIEVIRANMTRGAQRDPRVMGASARAARRGRSGGRAAWAARHAIRRPRVGGGASTRRAPVPTPAGSAAHSRAATYRASRRRVGHEVCGRRPAIRPALPRPRRRS